MSKSATHRPNALFVLHACGVFPELILQFCYIQYMCISQMRLTTMGEKPCRRPVTTEGEDCSVTDGKDDQTPTGKS